MNESPGIPFSEQLADGLQVLRYNQSTAYVSHLDWIEGFLRQYLSTIHKNAA